MTSDNVHSYTYDAENRLTAVDGGATAAYAYDANGHRVQKITGGTTTEYIYDLSGNVVADVNGANVLQAAYSYLGDSLFAEYAYDLTLFVHKDHLGSTRVLTTYNTTAAQNAQVSDSMDYLPYGEQISGGSTTTHKFTGKERDAESGLDDFEARHYSSSLGRFMQTDPIVVTTDRMLDPQQLNLYSYVRNTPTVLVDPTGETLTISGSLGQAQSYLQQIAGDGAHVDCDKTSNSCQITGNDGCDASVACPTGGSTANEGVNLLANLIMSQSHYDLHVGDSIPTAGGDVGLDGDKRGSIEGNLDNKPDKNGNQKPATSRPPAGVDDEVAINPNYKGKFGSDNKLGTAPLWTIAFHELAEAYAKIDGRMAYLGAHAAAAARENILRDERPNLKAYNPGAGDHQIYDVTDIKIKH